jgi:Heavy metal binding domain
MLNETAARAWIGGFALSAIIAAIVGLALAGCGQLASKSNGTPGKPDGHRDAADHHGHANKGDHASVGHSHIAPHGGQVQSVGDNHFELTYDETNGRFALYVLGEQESKSAPIPESDIALQIRDEESGEFHSAKLGADPLEDDSAGESSRFSATSPELAKIRNFTAVVRVPISGESHRVSFQFADSKPISARVAIAPDGFACPMNCEEGKVYPKQGDCPVCEMKLEEYKAGSTAHADHSPKHGGIFFMAPDNWHHLEGTLVTEQELRIYLYDNFTKPMDSAGYSGELKVQPVNDQDDAVGEAVTIPIKPVAGKTYLMAQLPDTIKPPIQTEARLQFPKAKEKYLFNFDFKGVQHKD